MKIFWHACPLNPPSCSIQWTTISKHTTSKSFNYNQITIHQWFAKASCSLMAVAHSIYSTHNTAKVISGGYKLLFQQAYVRMDKNWSFDNLYRSDIFITGAVMNALSFCVSRKQVWAFNRDDQSLNKWLPQTTSSSAAPLTWKHR